MTLGNMAEDLQDVSGKIKRFENASIKLQNVPYRGPENKIKVKDVNDNYTSESDAKQESVGTRIQLAKARLRSIDEEKNAKDNEKPKSPRSPRSPKSPNRSPNNVENRNMKSVSNENLIPVGSPELRRKLSSHFLDRKSSAPALLGTASDGNVPSKVEDQKEDEEWVKEDVPPMFVFPGISSAKPAETKEVQDGEKEELGEDEEDGGHAGGKNEGKGMTRRLASSVKRVKSIRFHSKREKKHQDVDVTKRKKEDAVKEDCKVADDKEKIPVSIIVSKAPIESSPNQEIMKELSSFKFKPPRSIVDRSSTKITSDKVSPEVTLIGEMPKHGGGKERSKGFAALRTNRHRNPRAQLPTPPAKPQSHKRQVDSIHEYDLIHIGDATALDPSTKNVDNEKEDEPVNVTEETRVYAVLCPSDEEEDDKDSSDVDPSHLEDIPRFNDTSPLATRRAPKPVVFAEHVYEDIDLVMTHVNKPPVCPAPVIGAYQVSDLTHSDPIETVAPVVYDEPQTKTNPSKPLSYDQPSSFPPSRDNSWNSGTGDPGVVTNPGVSRNNWASRLPSESQTPTRYDVPQPGPTAPQRHPLGTGTGGSTPHSPITVLPPQEDQNVPRGWRVEQTVTRDPVFINEITSERWYRAKPTDGTEPYYYSEDRSQTGWELPAVASPPRHRIISDGGGRADDPTILLPNHQLRTGRVRPHSFHPHMRPSNPSLPSESRLFDKEEIKRRFSNRISVYSPMMEIAVREKEGALSMMPMKDRGRQKKWRPGYAVLAGSNFKYYKDHKHFERDSSNPEVSLNLWKADVCWTRSRTPAKRLNFELTTDKGMFSIQGEDEAISMSWFEAIRGAVAGRRGSSEENDDNLPPSGQSPGVSPSPDGHHMKKSNTTIRDKLTNFFRQRPEKDELPKGVFQEENVFGKDIRKLCERERTTVPKFVHQCIKYIDRRGLECDGIYRVSGNLSLIQKLRFKVDQEDPIDLETSPWKEDIHVITGALKLYFRELPEPLFTFKTFDKFIASMTHIPNVDKKILAFRALLEEMPRVNQDTIFALFSHLKRVMDNVQHNRMPAKNLATVFGPTLMWPERENMNMTMATVYQNQVIEFVLLEFDNIFRS